MVFFPITLLSNLNTTVLLAIGVVLQNLSREMYSQATTIEKWGASTEASGFVVPSNYTLPSIPPSRESNPWLMTKH